MQITCWTYKTDHNKVKKVYLMQCTSFGHYTIMAIFDSIENAHFFKVKNTIDSLLFCTWLIKKYKWALNY